METLLTSLNIAGLVLALFFISLLLSKKDKQLREYLLAFFILLLGTFLLIKYVFQYDLYNSYPLIIYLDICYWVLLGPTLYIYTLVSIRGENHLRINYLYTLIPALLVSICFSQYIFGNVADLFNNWENAPTIALVGRYIWLWNSPVFYILTILALRKHRDNIKDYYSYSKSVDLKWLNYLSHGFAVFILFLLTRGIVYDLLGWDLSFDNYSLSLVVAFIYIFGIGFFGYRQRGIFDDFKEIETPVKNLELVQSPEIKDIVNQLSYQKSGLNNEEAHLILNKLEQIMLSEELFLESELYLAALADKVDVSTHKLSQVINEYLNKNFFDFVNEYRIERVKEFLSNPEYNQLKIVSLAYDSGFSSKSTFYTTFKKSEGITPAEYRKKYQKSA